MNKISTIFAEIAKPRTVGDGGNTLTTDVAGIINGVIGALGIVAVIVIIMGGVSYMTSAGDSSKVKKAKDTILYGVIGLIIVMLSFAIVNWVIGVGNTTE
jgi:hypothetical protein